MQKQPEEKEPFAFWLVRQFLEPDEQSPDPADGLTDRELYSTFAFIVITLAIFALTIGPFSLLR